MSYDVIDYYCEECEKETTHVHDSELLHKCEYVCNECDTLITLNEKGE